MRSIVERIIQFILCCTVIPGALNAVSNICNQPRSHAQTEANSWILDYPIRPLLVHMLANANESHKIFFASHLFSQGEEQMDIYLDLDENGALRLYTSFVC